MKDEIYKLPEDNSIKNAKDIFKHCTFSDGVDWLRSNLQPVPAPLRREEIIDYIQARITKAFSNGCQNYEKGQLELAIDIITRLIPPDFTSISQEVESPAENNAKEVSEKYYKMGMMQGFRILQSYLNFSEQKEFGFQNPDKMLKRIDSEFKKAIIG